MAPNTGTKESWLTPELKKQIAHVALFAITTLTVGLLNSTGNEGEVYELNRKSPPQAAPLPDSATAVDEAK